MVALGAGRTSLLTSVLFAVILVPKEAASQSSALTKGSRFPTATTPPRRPPPGNSSSRQHRSLPIPPAPLAAPEHLLAALERLVDH